MDGGVRGILASGPNVCVILSSLPDHVSSMEEIALLANHLYERGRIRPFTVKPPKTVEASATSTVAWWKNPGVIYFIAAGEPPIAIKIGMAAITGKRDMKATIVRRLSQIQSSNHERIRLLGVIHFTNGEYPTRDAEAKERELHHEFEHFCRFAAYTRGAEWFNPAPELLARIEQVATTPETLQLPTFFPSVAENEAGCS